MKQVFVFIIFLGTACAARLTGSITTTTSAVPFQTTVYAINTVTGNGYQTRTGASSYNLDVEDGHSYSVYAAASGAYNVSGWNVDGFMPYSAGLVTVGDNEAITINITFEPAYTLILISYTNGTLRQLSDYSSYLWTTDMSGAPSRFYRSLASRNGMKTAALAVPLNTQVSIMSEAQFATTGRILLSADNSGVGFGSENQGGVVVQLNYEMARTAANSVQQKLQNSDRGSNFSPQAATIDVLAGPFASEQLRAMTADQVQEESILAETAWELSRAEASISQYRTSNVSIRGTDEMGRNVPGLSISIQQKSHSFKFGVHGGQKSALSMDAWKMLADSGVNAAVVDFWWSKTEPKEGLIEEEWILNQKIDYLASLGMSLTATGIFQPDPNILPDYVKGLNSDQFGQALYDHVFALVSKYCTNFDIIEVSTDLNNLASILGYNTTEILALQQISLNAIRAAAPGVRTSVTTSNTFDPKSPLPSLSSAQFHRKWASLGQPIDLIGQALYDGDVDQPRYTVGALSDLLNSVSSTGRSIRISQVSAPYAMSVEKEEREFLQQLYTIAFSKKLVKEVSWWDFMGDGALFAGDQTPTASYWALREFIQSHRSDMKLNVEKGNTQFVSPFGGRYEVIVYKDGNVIGQSEIYLGEGRQNNMAIIYRNDGAGIVLLNQPNGPVLGVVPAPLPFSPNTEESSLRLPQWSIFVIIFGSIAVVSLVAFLAAFLVLRRGKGKGQDSSKQGSPEGSPLPGKSYEIDLEVGTNVGVTPLDEVVPDSPSPWRGQPLTNVILEEVEDEVQDHSEESDESSELEDVELDEHDVSTSTTDTEEEHL